MTMLGQESLQAPEVKPLLENESRIEQLVSRWDELKARGVAISLEDLCLECPALVDEVRRRIEVVSHIDLVMETVTSSQLAILRDGDLAPTPDCGIPATVGRYRVIRQLGQGGFGRVYLCHDDDLDRPVAIKVPNPERIAGSEHAVAFLKEARALAELEHPHIVPVYDVGRAADGSLYLVSKYIEGSNLAQHLASARLSFQESAELVRVVAGALHHAHTRGLFHRDIKPANILIDPAGRPFVTDFGLALRDDDFGKVRVMAGTPSYMSPEQGRGEGHLVDGRSDIFSLGVVLYELLTGRRPFRGERSELLNQIISVDPRPPRQIDDTIPASWSGSVCGRSPSARPSDTPPPATWRRTCASFSPPARGLRALRLRARTRRLRPARQHRPAPANLGQISSRTTSFPRGSGHSTSMTPTFSSNCCPARATGMAFRIASGSGRRASNQPTPRKPSA